MDWVEWAQAAVEADRNAAAREQGYTTHLMKLLYPQVGKQTRPQPFIIIIETSPETPLRRAPAGVVLRHREAAPERTPLAQVGQTGLLSSSSIIIKKLLNVPERDIRTILDPLRVARQALLRMYVLFYG
jgi:hypothetical protein